MTTALTFKYGMTEEEYKQYLEDEKAMDELMSDPEFVEYLTKLNDEAIERQFAEIDF